jgi:hypothetical protein
LSDEAYRFRIFDGCGLVDEESPFQATTMMLPSNWKASETVDC